MESGTQFLVFWATTFHFLLNFFWLPLSTFYSKNGKKQFFWLPLSTFSQKMAPPFPFYPKKKNASFFAFYASYRIFSNVEVFLPCTFEKHLCVRQNKCHHFSYKDFSIFLTPVFYLQLYQT